MAKSNNFNYVLFVGDKRDSLFPVSVFDNENEALDEAKGFAADGVYELVGLYFMTGKSRDTRVIWSNF
mgnify:CR=1 FL=1